MNATVTLVLGGARSGKSAWAEHLAAASGRPVAYLATAVAGDEEMAARIAAHRAARSPQWRTIEAPYDVTDAMLAQVTEGEVVLVDCLTFWVSNLLLREIGDDPDVAMTTAEVQAQEDDVVARTHALLDAAPRVGVDLILVSNEVGMGLVPPFPLGRLYRDVLGRVNQTVAQRADSVVLMVAGLPIDLRQLTRVTPGWPDS
ncbi:MAG: bifunctional adenosylcobinamide kinase/adenosylcobinamide-phosphate guanylyltransferase [Thermomicrobiales bacterium]